MAKFVLVKDYGMFDEIKDYIKKNPYKSYYIAPKLMHDYLSSLRYRCVTGLIMEDIKICEHDKIDLLTMPVYNKVFDAPVFRVEGIKDCRLKKVEHEFKYESIVFGIDKDLKDFTCDVEELE